MSMTYQSLLSVTPEVLGTPCITLLGHETQKATAAQAARQQRLSVTHEDLSLLSDLAVLLFLNLCIDMRYRL